MTPISELTDRTRRAQDKARVLNEALPWLTRWAGRTIVVKFGGNVGADTEEALTAAFCSDVALLRRVGLNVVVVHGGGPQISALAERLGHVSRFVDGLRVTDAAMLDIVRMVLLGQVNPQLAGMIGAAGAAAVGVAGTDAGLVTAAARDPRLGFVGDVLAVDPAILLTLLSDGVVPVVATVARGVDPDGRAQDFNVNADTVAGAIAVALGADKLIFLSNVPGLYEEFGTADSSLLSEVDAGRLQGMLDRGELHTGMVPKVRSIIEALAGGVARAHLLDGRIEHALLLEIFTDEGIGTMVLPDPTQHPAPRTRAGELRVTGGTGTPRTGTPRTGTPSPGTPSPGIPGTGTRELMAREAEALLPTYARRPIAFTSGSGAWLTDAEGARYLDFLSGLAVTSLGHAHPAVTAAVSAQAARLTHTSNLFTTEPQVRLAERLQATLGWPDGKAFFCNSGAEANEAAIKLARRHGLRQHDGKVKVVALEGGFHGRLLGALLVTGNPAKHAPFQPLGDWVTHVPVDDPQALTDAVDDDTCAVWVEVVQGEGGIKPVSEAMLAAARDACDRVGALLVVDEVQTGVGRLGAWYGWQQTGVVPDVVCLAKALANGLPIGVIVARGTAAQAFGPGDHATTFGGGPVICAAALAVLDTIERDGLVERARVLGEVMARRLAELVDRHPLAAGVRGRGLLQALVLAEPVAADVVGCALQRGLVVNDVAPDAVRLAPPLTIDDADIDEMARRLDHALGDVAAASGSDSRSAPLPAGGGRR